MEITATLNGWYIDNDRVYGAIHGDVRGRWVDTTPVRTSLIQSMDTDAAEEGTVVTTMNSTYLLGTPAKSLY